MDETRRRTTHSLSRSLTHSLPATFFLLSFALSSVFSSHVKSRQERQRTTPTPGGRVSPAIIGLRDALRVMSCEPCVYLIVVCRSEPLSKFLSELQFSSIRIHHEGACGQEMPPGDASSSRNQSVKHHDTNEVLSRRPPPPHNHGCRINAARG